MNTSLKVLNNLKTKIQRAKEVNLKHRNIDSSEFWKKIPAYKNVSYDEFIDIKFQNKHTVTNIKKLYATVGEIAGEKFLKDVESGLKISPMNIRLSPYIISLIDWDDPYNDPLRIQFLPVASTKFEDHPQVGLDSLNEQADSPVDGLVHRYADKALFLALDVCPVYCQYCTRSYAIGSDTDTVEKESFKPVPKNWEKAFEYIEAHEEIEDIVISGGDTFMLAPDRIKQIGERLLHIPHIRRIRYASKGMAVLPMKILTDTQWRDNLIEVAKLGKKLFKEVCMHTHFSHPKEITGITQEAMKRLFENGVTVRNQCVMIRNVNDDADIMIELTKKLSLINIQPYYVYQHDMVQGVEDLRTTVAKTVEIEKTVRGTTAGFNTPLFVNDAPGGGGKRDLHSYEYYNRVTGISVYRSPSVDKDKLYLYFDPIDQLSKEGQTLWADKNNHEKMINDAKKKALLNRK